MEEINIQPQSIEQLVGQLDSQVHSLSTLAQTADAPPLDGGFSPVSGLDQLGGSHGNVIKGTHGSARAILRSFAEQMEWLRNTLQQNGRIFEGQDTAARHGIDKADMGGTIGEENQDISDRPDPRFDPFSFDHPHVSKAASISQLQSEFSATKINQAHEATSLWQQLASGVLDISNGLVEVANKLRSDNTGLAIDKAVERIDEVAQAGAVFGNNASTMAKYTDRIAWVHSSGAKAADHYAAILASIKDPAKRKAMEQILLSAFQRDFSTATSLAIPSIRNLMDAEVNGGGGGDVTLGMDDIAGKGSRPTTDGLRAPGMIADAMARATQPAGLGSFSSTDSALQGLGGVGNMPAAHSQALANSVGSKVDGLSMDAITPSNISDIMTRASAALPTAPGSGLSGINPTAIPGAAGIGGAPSLGGTLAIGSPSVSGAGGLANAGSTSALPGTNVAGLPTNRPSVSSAPIGLGPMAGAGGNAGVGGSRNPNASGLGHIGNARSTDIGGVMPAGGLPGGMAGRPTGTTGSAPRGFGSAGSAIGGMSGGLAGGSAGGGVNGSLAGGTGVGPGTSAASAGSSQAGNSARGGMMGAPMGAAGGQGGKRKKVKAVTAQVEKEKNIEDLVGKPKPMVPGVIGAWVRED